MPDFDVNVTELDSGNLSIDVNTPFSGCGIESVVINGKKLVPSDLRICKIVLTIDADNPVSMNLECLVPEQKNE